jgi:hypothetical protein
MLNNQQSGLTPEKLQLFITGSRACRATKSVKENASSFGIESLNSMDSIRAMPDWVVLGSHFISGGSGKKSSVTSMTVVTTKGIGAVGVANLLRLSALYPQQFVDSMDFSEIVVDS